MLHLLAYTKLCKDDAKQIIGTELAGDFVQRHLRQAQLFGQQIQRLRLSGQASAGRIQVGLDPLQSLHMALPRDVEPLRRGLPPCQVQQLLAHHIQPLTSPSRQANTL